MIENLDPDNPFSPEGIERIADWMVPRIRQSAMFNMALAARDADLLAVALQGMLAEYLAEIGYEANVRQDKNLVIISTDDDEDDPEMVNVSVPLTRALFQRLYGSGGGRIF